MLLEGAYVIPRQAERLGFAFRFERVEDALADLIPVVHPARRCCVRVSLPFSLNHSRNGIFLDLKIAAHA